MQYIFSIFFISFLSIGTLVPLAANETAVALKAGGMVFKKSQNLTMVSELLEISLEDIRVSYVFHNKTNKDIVEQIAFPLPLSPYGKDQNQQLTDQAYEEAMQAYRQLADNPKAIEGAEVPAFNQSPPLNWAPFINFQRTVNGAEAPVTYRMRAIDDTHKDITLVLQSHQIPLSLVYWPNDEIAQQPRMLEKMRSLGLLTPQGRPNWKLQTVYLWTQNFPANQSLSVTHRYRPQVGQYFLESQVPRAKLTSLSQVRLVGSDDSKARLSHYCFKPQDAQKLLSLIQHQDPQDAPYTIKEIRYVLKTGANWKGPIRDFRLEIQLPKPNSIIGLCLKGAVQKRDGQKVVVTMKNFKPTDDLKILIFSEMPEA